MDFSLGQAIGRLGFEGKLTTGHIIVLGQGKGKAIQPWRATSTFLVGRVNLEGKFLETPSMRPQTRLLLGSTHQAIVGTNETSLARSAEMDGDMIGSWTGKQQLIFQDSGWNYLLYQQQW